MMPVYVNDIKCSLKNKCYFSALALALTLPDICGMLEFPEESVAGRYIRWYDKYIGEYMAEGKDELGGNNPWLSGEIIYNLRNTFLHQGNPGIAREKVKEEANRLDRFTLMLGDGKVLYTGTMAMEFGMPLTGKVEYRAIIVDVSYLCASICNGAQSYYCRNREKFMQCFDVVTQEELLSPSEGAMRTTGEDWIAKIVEHKLKEKGVTAKVEINPEHKIKQEWKKSSEIEMTEE